MLATLERPNFSERCRSEATRDVIFLFQWRVSKSKIARDNGWITEGVWLSREEAEAFGNAHAYRYPSGWRVYGVCSNGELTDLIRNT